MLLCAALLHQLRDRKPPYFSRPRTIVDHSSFSRRSLPDFLLLIEKAQKIIPRGARVTAFRPVDGKARDEPLANLTLSGMLPRHVVVPGWMAGDDFSLEELPDYVIAMDEVFTQPGYREVAAFPEGRIYKVER